MCLQFVGRLIAKAIFDGKLLDCYFTRAMYKHILNKVVKLATLQIVIVLLLLHSMVYMIVVMLQLS